MDTITKIREKINLFVENSHFFTGIKILFIISLMGTSFLFGRLSEKETYNKTPSPVEIYLPSGEILTSQNSIVPHNQLSAYILNGATQQVPISSPTLDERLSVIEATNSTSETQTSQLFGSKSGSTYYTPGCKSGNRVKVENRVYFEDEADAEDQGYTKSKLCK